jgi:hypothetical protein
LRLRARPNVDLRLVLDAWSLDFSFRTRVDSSIEERH